MVETIPETAPEAILEAIPEAIATPAPRPYKAPEDCATMREVRQAVDAVDWQIVSLLAQRFGYMEAAARIKSERDSVRDEKRKAQVLDNIAYHAQHYGLDSKGLVALWDTLIEQSISYEFEKWDNQRGK